MLRSNQIEPVRKGIEFFKSKNPKPSLIIAPTAFGKSHVISTIAHEVGKILVLQPSKELLMQNIAKLKAMGGGASIYSASLKTKEIGDITYATLGSIKNIGETFKKMGFTNLIIDEADRYARSSEGMLSKFLISSGITHVLGLTATPLQLQTNSNLGESYSILKMLTSRSKKGNFFKEIIHICQIKEMVELEFWSPLIYEVEEFQEKDLIFNSSRSEYTEKSLEQTYKAQNIPEKIIHWAYKCNRKSILIFVPSVAYAHDLALKIPGSEVVWGDMDIKERDRVIQGFKNLSIRVVINVNVLSIGFDHPELDCIICGRKTASLSWWYQVVGRITRIHPNKKNGLIVDLVGNTKTFGRIEELFFTKKGKLWELFGEGNKQLTNIPMTEIGNVLKEAEISLGESNILTFGKFSGKKVCETPMWWRRWMLENYKWDSKTMHIKKELEL